jgi:hypothetical protein
MSDGDPDFSAFDANDWEAQEAQDAATISNAISSMGEPGGGIPGLANPDAKYMDLSDDDDDLPDEEPPADADGDVPGLTDDQGDSHDTDDLFGDGGQEEDLFGEMEVAQKKAEDGEAEEDVEVEEERELDLVALYKLNFPEQHSNSNQDPNIPEPAVDLDQLRKLLFPTFEHGIHLNLNDLLGPRPAHFVPKLPVKTPKILAPTKVSLDLAPDQEKLFRTTGPAQSNKRKRIQEAEAKGFVAIVEESSDEQSEVEDFDFSEPPPDEMIGRVSWAKLKTLSANLDVMGSDKNEDEGVEEEEPMDEWEQLILGHSSKRRKTNTYKEPDYFNTTTWTAPSFDNYEQDTARLGKHVILHEDDAYLLLERVEPELQHAAKRQRIPGGFAKRGGGLNASLKSRFNYSNDEAYDALKENHAHKVRATLGHEMVEHSMPALRLQWPYYKTRLTAKQARMFHRPRNSFTNFTNRTISFSLSGQRKKKHMASLPSNAAFQKCEDLSLKEHHSIATLFEYCEEQPMILSNFGMGNRILNYYRRKEATDNFRPTFDDKLGDLHVLLPEDKSPFTKFGMVDPGESVRSIHNGMYRAPIFKQPVKPTDFLVVRSETQQGGADWYMRNIDNLFVVGQQLPIMEVPGPSSRKHTNVNKNRMRMIGCRSIRHNSTKSVPFTAMHAHFPNTSTSQHKTKMKDSFSYQKGDKSWKVKPGEEIPDEATIRSWIKPEDVCGIDAMQVGCQQLKDTGHNVAGLEGQDELRDEKMEKVKYDDKSLDEKLAPWISSKAFTDATEGKAMLQLHGEGDPTGCGLGISFVKISMKGGYQGGPSATSDAAMTAAEKKANGGHSYNVKKQEAAYEAEIRNIWQRQKESLTNTIEPAEDDMDIYEDDEGDQVGLNDDTASQFGAPSDMGGSSKALKIMRKVKGAFGTIEEAPPIYIEDPQVIKAYIRRREAMGHTAAYGFRGGKSEICANFFQQYHRLHTNGKSGD